MSLLLAGTFQTWPTKRTMSVSGVKADDGRARFDFRFLTLTRHQWRKRNLVPRQRKRFTDSPEPLEGTVDPKLLDILVCRVSKDALEFGWTRRN